MAARNETTWNRDDRDLLVELRTEMVNVRNKIDSVEGQIKEINTGITARLLNLEGNAVNKLQFDQLEDRVTSLEGSRIAFRSSLKVWIIVGGGAWSFVLLVASAILGAYFH